MFKIVLGVVLALSVGGVSYASADVLNFLHLPVAQQGSTDDLQCDEDGINAVLNPNNHNDTAIVDNVRLTGISNHCVGTHIVVNLTVDGTPVAESSVDHTVDGNETVPFNPPNGFGSSPLYSDVNDIHITFSGLADNP